jgi:thermitase
VKGSDNNGAVGITQTLYIDGLQKAKATGGSLAYNWNTKKVSTGTHVIQAVATDAAGNKATTSVQVSR